MKISALLLSSFFATSVSGAGPGENKNITLAKLEMDVQDITSCLRREYKIRTAYEEHIDEVASPEKKENLAKELYNINEYISDLENQKKQLTQEIRVICHKP